MLLSTAREATNSAATQELPVFYGSRRFITAFTRALHLSLPCTRPIQSIQPHLISPRWFPTKKSHISGNERKADDITQQNLMKQRNSMRINRRMLLFQHRRLASKDQFSTDISSLNNMYILPVQRYLLAININKNQANLQIQNIWKVCIQI
jgi:hypothetical protein